MLRHILPLLMLSFSAEAFTLNNSGGASFGYDEVEINVEGSSACLNIGLTNEELLDIAYEGVDDFWNRAPTSRLHLKKGEVISLSNKFHTDPMCKAGTNCTPNPDLVVPSGIVISCNTNNTDFSSSRILGLTLPNHIQNRTILGALVLINDKAGTQFESKTRHEKKTILAHEIGHALGLGHSPIKDSLMYYLHNENRHYLGQDDIDGIAFLYPMEQPKIAACGTVETQNKNAPLEGALLTLLGLFVGIRGTGLLFSKRSSAL